MNKPEPLKGKCHRMEWRTNRSLGYVRAFQYVDVRAAVEWLKDMTDLICNAYDEGHVTNSELEWWDENLVGEAFEDVMKDD